MHKSLLQYYNNNDIWNTSKTDVFYKHFLHNSGSVTQENTLKT